MKKEHKEIIKEIISELLQKAGLEAKIEVLDQKGGDPENVVCNIDLKSEPNLLIGQYGANLQALQHIVRLLVRKRLKEKVKFILDVNQYRTQKSETIIDAARQAAKEAVLEGKAVIMRPMSAYERRLVHLELSSNEKVKTESIGEGENRKVIIKPIQQK